jgi:hypothetical protein
MAEALARSGLTAVEFASRHGIGVWRVRRWSQDRRPPLVGKAALAVVKPSPAVRFAPVRIAGGTAAAGTLEVVVGRAVVRVGRDFDADLLRRVVLALGDGPC